MKVFAFLLIVIGAISIWLSTLMTVNPGDVGGYVILVGGCLLILVGVRYVIKMNA